MIEGFACHAEADSFSHKVKLLIC